MRVETFCVVEIVSYDEHFLKDFNNIISHAGHHKLKCVTWKPIGNWRQRIRSYFVGGGPILRNSDIIYTGPDRYRLTTVAMGTIHLQLDIVLRCFDKFGIECG